MPSLWKAETELKPYAQLEEDAVCDLLVVGSGIAGLSSAYEAARFGAMVIVIDRGDITGGMTARTTAHLASELDDYFAELVRVVGEDQARLYHESQVAAINRIEAICADEGIDADYKRLPGYLVAARSEDQNQLEDEYKACRQIEVKVEWTDSAPVRFPIAPRRFGLENTRAFTHSNIALVLLGRSSVAAAGCSPARPMSATTKAKMAW